MIHQEIDPAKLLALANSIQADLLAGLGMGQCQEARLESARLNMAHYELEGIDLIPRRLHESVQDHLRRPKTALPFVQRAIDVKTEDLYAPGPTRQVKDDPAVSDELNEIYAQNRINSQLQECDRFSMLNDVAAIQVVATGDRARPIKLQPWSADQFAVFTAPGDACCPAVMVTQEDCGGVTKWTLYTRDEIRTYEKPKTSGLLQVPGRLDPKLTDAIANPYKTLPFAFFHKELPLTGFWRRAFGTYLRKVEARLNDDLSNLEESIERFGKPRGIAYNAQADFNIVDKPGEFIKVAPPAGIGFDKPAPISLGYLDANLHITEIWEHVRSTVGEVTQGLGIPLAVSKADSGAVASGVAQLIEADPLIRQTRNRRPAWECYEEQLAKTILNVAGHYYDRPDLLQAALDLVLLLTWPEPLDVMGMEKDEADARDIEAGRASRLMVLQKRLGISREQAIAHLKQVAEDEKAVAAILPPPPAPPAPNPDDPNQPDDPAAELDSEGNPLPEDEAAR